MIINLNVFRYSMEHRIGGQIFSTQIITPQLTNLGSLYTNFFQQNLNPLISVVAFATALYSASMLDLETVACFRALQKTKLDPRKIANPAADLLSSREPAQSASENPLTNKDLQRLTLNPIFVFAFTYLNILLTADQCTSVGACRN
jgi:hypothetical protein